MNNLESWTVFVAFIVALLALDLGVFNRRPHPVRFRAAVGLTVFWVAMAIAVGLTIYWRYGAETALQFGTSYLLEISLSADNVFLFALIFASMAVAAEHHHRVLYWGVLGALVFRGTFIVAGVQLVSHFHAVLYGFAIFLIFMGVRLLREPSRKYDPSHSRVVDLARRLFPIANDDGGGHFFARVAGRVYATPLLLVLIVIEVVDITFATDSIPAIFAITQDAFIIFASNVLAILCLRSLYFLLARGLSRFTYLRPALAIILVFIGAKMLAERWIHLPTVIPLVGTLLILATGVLASLATKKRTA